MFLCAKCHNHDADGQYRHQGGSYGPCEACGKVANCDDCKWIPTREWSEALDQKLAQAVKFRRNRSSR